MTSSGGKFSKVRDERIDSVKFWLIFLVIAAHVFMRKEFAGSAACAVMWNWICIFCMPLFIFISGYFSRKKKKKEFWPSIWILLEPLIIFQALTLLPRIIHKGMDSLFVSILTPWWILWYLLSLIYWRLILQFLPDKILRHTKIVLICTFCISILAGFLPFDRFLSIQRTLAFMPFFFLGYYMKGKNLYLPHKYKPLCILFLISTFTIPLFFSQYLGNLMHAVPYRDIFGALNRMFVFALAIPMSIAFVNACYNKPCISRQGRLTMQYYIYHALIIQPLMIIACKQNVSMSFITATIITIGITLGICLVLNIPYIQKLTNPSSFIKK